MRLSARAAVACLLCEALIFLPVGWGRPNQPRQSSSPASGDLRGYLQKSYLELFELSPKLEFTPAQIDQMREELKKGKEYCVAQYKKRGSDYDSQLKQAQSQLKQVSARVGESERHQLHCRIQNLRVLKSQTEVLAQHAVPIAYENKMAKLELIEKWPADLQQIRQAIAGGSYLNRRWGDVKDIGFREIAPGQEDDIRTGQEAVRRMKENGVLPHEVEDEAIQKYVNSVAQRIAAHSDLGIPLHVTLLNSKEVNAFALPGGFLFVERGLLEAADDESELAGVLAHEIGHDTARHAHKLLKQATIADLFFQAAEIAAVVLTGGVAGIGTYYALQYGFYGLGLVLDLKLLGVSREYELEADQLGIQYAWNSGYDPSGFIRFFDKIATREGYVNGLSWFRTHPPFYQRMVDAQREISFLPKKPEMVVQTSAFEQMKKELVKVTAQAEKEEENRPSLLAPEQGCPASQKIEYKPGMPIESICPSPATPSKAGQSAQR